MDGDISGLVGKAVLQEEHRNSNPSQAPQSTLCGQLCAQSSVRWKQLNGGHYLCLWEVCPADMFIEPIHCCHGQGLHYYHFFELVGII